jgi:hypothetical protein
MASCGLLPLVTTDQVSHRVLAAAQTDQSPHRDEFYCIQSLMNLLPNGPKDGGISVMKGSSALFGDFVKAFNATEVSTPQSVLGPSPQLLLAQDCPPGDHFRYTDEHMAWFKEHGCEWVKPSLGPGDVIFWDSRTAHTAAAPSGGKHRFAVCELAMIDSVTAISLSIRPMQTLATNQLRE